MRVIFGPEVILFHYFCDAYLRFIYVDLMKIYVLVPPGSRPQDEWPENLLTNLCISYLGLFLPTALELSGQKNKLKKRKNFSVYMFCIFLLIFLIFFSSTLAWHPILPCQHP
jgi:hypothetical protein